MGDPGWEKSGSGLIIPVPVPGPFFKLKIRKIWTFA
jgi:hypothetical protein